LTTFIQFPIGLFANFTLVGSGKELSMDLRSIKNKIQHDNAEMDDDVRPQIIMPLTWTKRGRTKREQIYFLADGRPQ
jgi:hypothetical protein